jgi:hypothetical protein
MTAWMLTFVLITTVNGRSVETPTVAYVSTAEACVGLMRARQDTLPRNARMVRPECREVWRT